MGGRLLLTTEVKPEFLGQFMKHLGGCGVQSDLSKEIKIAEIIDMDETIEIIFIPLYAGYADPQEFYQEVKEWVTDIWCLDIFAGNIGKDREDSWWSCKKESKTKEYTEEDS